MLLLTAATDTFQVNTNTTVDLQAVVSYVDLVAGAITPGRVAMGITAIGDTAVVAGPASGQRNIKNFSLYNKAATSTTIAIQLLVAAVSYKIAQALIPPNCVFLLDEEGNWEILSPNGVPLQEDLIEERLFPVFFMKTTTAADATGYWYGSWKDNGVPGAFVPPSGLAGSVNARNSGAIVVPTGYSTYRLRAITLASSIAHLHLFADILWSNSGLSVTTLTAQTVNSGPLLGRVDSGDEDGRDCRIGLMVTTASTLAAVNSLATVSYTNTLGVAGRTATLAAGVGSQIPATPVVGTVVWFNLQSGDVGVRSIQTFTIGATSWLTGAISLFIARPIAYIAVPAANIPVRVQFPGKGISLSTNFTILHFILASAATATFLTGALEVEAV